MSTTQPGTPEQPPPDPMRRYGWVFWGAWLIFLVFPVMGAFDAPSLLLTVMGLLGTAAFAAVYVVGFLGHTGRGPLAGLRRTALVLLLLVLVVAATAPALGLGVLAFMPFLVAMGMFLLPRPANWYWAGLVVVISLALPWALEPSSGWFFLFFIVVAVALGTGAGRLIDDQGAAYAQVRDELTATAERDRVARDVHDLLGHSLTVVSVKAELAERLIDRDPERARAELADIQALSRQALAEVRATVGGLRAARLDDEVAGAAVALRAAGIEADLPTATDVLDPRRRGVAAWVLREAVTNVVRHSEARRCVVTLHPTGLTVRDDGRGVVGPVPGTGAEDGSGSGLLGLRRRVVDSGGRLDVRPASGGGTELEVSW